VLRPVLALLAACALPVVACGSGDDESPAGGAASTATTGRPPAQMSALPAGCRRVPAPPPKRERARRPTTRLDRDRRWTVFLETNCGTVAIRLATRGGPDSSTSFAALARRGFYDGLTFHRIAGDPATGPFVIQGGDPLGTGLGGPGYIVVDKPPPGTRYTRGTVAMAKTATEPRGASGSQFFIVTAADSGLPPDYALVGRVVGGKKTVERIASVQTDDQERPVAPVVIQHATLAGGS